MKYQRLIIPFAVVSTVILLPVLFAADSPPVAATVRWQHLAMETEPDLKGPETGPRINRLGREGWELVGVTPVTKDGATRKLIYFFKKPLD